MEKIFDNTQVAFSLKSDGELRKAYLLFKMMGSPGLVNAMAALTKFLLKLRFPIKGIIKNTVYRQFCGGLTKEDCLKVIRQLYAMNVH
ncbi:MAG: proline dehydrogenase, partial [Sinomicrobium sp.]|nr:proline dehydrogenase [Sinomicrobium sp.]